MARSLRSRIDAAYTSLLPKGSCPTCDLSNDAITEITIMCPSNRNVAEYQTDPPHVKRCPDCGKFPFIVIWRPPIQVVADEVDPISNDELYSTLE